MKKIEVTDELLYKYMPIADAMDLDALEEELEDEAFTLSPKVEKKMKHLIWKEKHKWVVDFGKFVTKVAVVCFCILTIGLAVTVSVDAYRSKFFQTVQELLGDSAIHTYDTNEDEQGFVPHEPTYIPEGYVEVSRVETESALNIMYKHTENGDLIVWDQTLISMEEQYVLDTEFINREYYQFNDGYITLSYYENDYKYAYYEKDNYVYILSADNIDVSKIHMIFQSIR